MKITDTSDFKFSFITITTLLFISEIVTVHFLYSSLNIFSTPLSIYATGKYWFLVTSGLLFISVNYIIISSCLLKTASPSVQLRIGSILLLIMGISIFFVATLQSDIGHQISVHGRLHIIAAHIHFTILPLSAIFISSGIREKSLIIYKRVTLVFGLICMGVVFALLFMKIADFKGYSGIIQKSLIMMILFWIIFSAETLRRYTNTMQRHSSLKNLM